MTRYWVTCWSQFNHCYSVWAPKKKVIFGLQDLCKGLFVAQEVRGWCHECQLLHHEWRQKVQSDKNSFSAKSQLFLDFETFEKALLWLSMWVGGVTRATFCITRGSLSWLVAPRDAKSGTHDTTPSPLVTQKGLFKGLEVQNEWFSAAKFFFTALIFAVSATNVIIYYFVSRGKSHSCTLILNETKTW